jgi:hypothetical protein
LRLKELFLPWGLRGISETRAATRFKGCTRVTGAARTTLVVETWLVFRFS